MKSTAQAHSNIALVKYWGKRDERLILPNNSSVSMTLDKFFTITTVDFDSKYSIDQFVLNGQKAGDNEEWKEVQKHLDLIRKTAHIRSRARVESKNNFPTAAGLASSASGLAALTLAASHATGLKLSEKELTILARQGSGSASRSIHGGFVEWKRGQRQDGEDSFGEQLASEKHWPELRMIVSIVKSEPKKWKSRSGMAQTVATCPFYPVWAETAEKDAVKMKEMVMKKDFTGVGELAEFNALKMHSTMFSTRPPIVYWEPVTVEIIRGIMEWREAGLETYFTMDAGPQVKILCREKDEKRLVRKLEGIRGIEKIEVCKPGPGAKLIERHLF